MTKRQRKSLYKILISAVLILLSAIFVKNEYVKIVLFCIAYAVSGFKVLCSAVRKILSRQLFDEEILMSAATVGALILHEFSEAAMVMTLYQLGELFQSVAVGKSRKSIKDLMKLKADFATVIREGQEVRVTPEEILKGETILVIPGEKVAVDGIIEEGFSFFDSSSLTGESIPRELKAGDRVFGGMINIQSPVKIKTESVYTQSTVAKILNLIETSSLYKSKSEKFITKFSRKYTPCVFFAALLTAVIPTLVFGQSFPVWLRRALVFLIVSCPCALVISVPLSFFGAIGAASKQGVLIKGSEHIETLSKTDTIAFDKTGTITKGKFSVSKICALGISEEKLLEITAYAESFSNHPIALSIIEAYGKEIPKERIKNVVTVHGKGISAEIDGKRVLAGNRQLLIDNGIYVQDNDEDGTCVYAAYENNAAGFILLEDKAKENASESLRALKKAGIKRIVMLTGDNEKTALKVQREVGADEVYAELLPQDKVEKAIEMKKDGVTAFVGDGINDAPVLSCVDVGFAMGALGSDAAVEAADIVIMNDDLSLIERAFTLSKKTMKIVRQNIALSLGVKFGVMALSISGFDNMYAAIFADVGVMIIAVLNSMRMMKMKRAASPASHSCPV